jgi:hypothetical protein
MSETKETLLDKIAHKVSVMLTGEDSKKEVKLEKAKLKDGTIVEIEGNDIFVLTEDNERLPAPVANHELENGDVVVVEEEGIVKEIIKAGETEDEDLKQDDKEKMEFASKEDMQNLKKEMDELRYMIEGKDKEEMSKVEAEKAELKKAELAKQELANQEPIKKVVHTPEGKPKSNINLYAQKSGGSTKSIVFKKLFS